MRKLLSAQHPQVIFFDQQAILSTAIDLTVGGHVEGVLRLAGGEVALEQIRSVYVRPYDIRRVPAVARAGPGSPELAHAELVESAMATWTELTDAFVVNRLSAMCSNGSKPYQSELIHAAGFDVPDTLLTTDPAAADAFWRRHGSVIYKSISGIRSIVSRLGPDDRARLDDVMTCPTQFQEYIQGTDVRVHVVGDSVFGCEVKSSADDYRYAARQVALEPSLRAYDVPVELAEACRRLAADLGLPVAGIDLRRTADGRWYCFEVNPSPAFTFYEDATGHGIARAVTELLISGRPGRSWELRRSSSSSAASPVQNPDAVE